MISKWIKLIFIIGTFILMLLALAPRKYDVLTFEKRSATKYWKLNTGSRIAYTLIESDFKEKRNPIIYLHGGPGGMIKNETIESLKPLSKKGHDIYFYDQIGSGHSDRLEDIKEYTVKRHQKDLKEIIKRINSNKVILIGHSWGSMLAMNYLIENESTIDKVILTGPGPILPINQALSKLQPPDSLKLTAPKYSNKEGNKKANNLRTKLVLKWATLFKKKLGSDTEMDNFFTFLSTELKKSTVCDGSKIKPSEGGSGYYSHIMTVNSFKDIPNKKEKLKNIKTPVLIIKGQCDNQKWGFTKEYLDLLSNSSLVIIEKSGHNLSKENQKEYLEIIGNFIN